MTFAKTIEIQKITFLSQVGANDGSISCEGRFWNSNDVRSGMLTLHSDGQPACSNAASQLRIPKMSQEGRTCANSDKICSKRNRQECPKKPDLRK